MRSGTGTGGRQRLGRLDPVLILLVLVLGAAGCLARLPAAAAPPAQAMPVPTEPAATPAAATPAPSIVTAPQPSFDGLRIQQDGAVLPYAVWSEWPPLLVTTADGGAWAFFTAQARKDAGLDALRLYAARFDPARGVWLPATALPGSNVQFGPSAAVDQAGTVHLFYSDRAADAPGVFSTLVYTRSDGRGGWAPPIPVAPDPDAGHQMTPSAAFDRTGKLHVLWRDQRNMTPEQRQAAPAFADVFASELNGTAWSDPIQVNRRPSPDLNASWPHLVAEGDRLVAVWSVYRATTREEFDRPATRVEWSSRPLADPAAWANPAPLIEQDGGSVGGSLVDVVADPRGGVLLAYSRIFTNGNDSTADVFLRRLEAGMPEWGPHLKVVSGDLGGSIAVAVAPDGTAFVGFNYGRERRVEVGALLLRSGAARAGPLSLPTSSEAGEQGRPAVATAADGRLWLLYLHADPDSRTVQIRATRGVELPG